MFKNKMKEPLVSVLIYNYNYGKYLRECFDSALNQTYKNIEIIFSDNASTDNSWDIAVEYAKKYNEKITIIRNRENFGSGSNLYNCYTKIRGKYYLVLCSDDILDKNFVQKTVNILEANHNTGYVITHRLIIDENSNKTYEAPFYKHSCIIPTAKQSEIYMMAGFNPSISQVMYRYINDTNYSLFSYPIKSYTFRLKDFYLSLNYDVGYIKKPLLYHRLHSKNNSVNISKDLLEIIGPYVLLFQYKELAQIYKAQNVIDRFDSAILKNANLSLRYSANAILKNDLKIAKRYFFLAGALDLDIIETKEYKLIKDFFDSGKKKQKDILSNLQNQKDFLYRTVSYDIPEGSIIIDE